MRDKRFEKCAKCNAYRPLAKLSKEDEERVQRGLEEVESAHQGDPDSHKCAICGKRSQKPQTKHHIIPKYYRTDSNRTKIIYVCRPCHDDIHFYLSAWDLAFRFSDSESIRAEVAARKEHEKQATIL